MKFPYHVFHNGVSYAPFEEVPIGIAQMETKEEKSVVEEQPTHKETEVSDIKPTPQYTKTDINRMPVDELRQLASENGINTVGVNGADLKKKLIEKLGL